MRPAVRGREGSGDRRGGGADLRAVFFIGKRTHHTRTHACKHTQRRESPSPMRGKRTWAGLKLYMGLDLLATDGPRVALSGADSTRICIYEVKDCVGKLTTDENTHG